MSYLERYKKLNVAQKEAVDTIDGPLMVIAGPGTGKTELLSVRIANILQKTDVLPENILCLTFTDSGANAMRQRLTDIIGKEAYKVAIHTFHSFGTEVINQNGEFFHQGAHFRPADELSSYEIIRNIFEKLDHNSPIGNQLNGEYIYLRDCLGAISELKKSGLTSDELFNILDQNDIAIEKTEQLISPIFGDRVNKNTALKISDTINIIRQSGDRPLIATIIPLSQIIADSLDLAVNESIDSNSTKPITAWKNAWLKKNEKGDFVLKSRESQKKLRAVGYVYNQYLTDMHEAALYDFDDMILRVVHAMEIFNDLRFNLQEKYQYIMVDEFQDTNMAQMRILLDLTNTESQGDMPNIMVVGDDDQAIYSFQGAEISNIIDFQKYFPKLKKVVLTENYRSAANILEGSRSLILQGNGRLENIFEDINKQLNANKKRPGEKAIIFETDSIASERHWIANNIKKRIESGQKPSDIAILTRRHHEIISLLPYFANIGVAVNYERHDNVIDIAPIVLIDNLSRLLIELASGRHDSVNGLLPEILAHESWGIKPIDIWKLSIKAYDSHTRWMDIMATMPQFIDLHTWLVNTAALSIQMPLEQILDIIIGKPDENIDEQDVFTSPIYNYFFSSDILDKNPDEYLTYLEALRTIRSKLREYRPDQTPTLKNFVEYIDLCRKTNSVISSSRKSAENENAINVMTAHKSKGQEFDTVFIINAVDNIWGERARNRSRLISYPENLQIAPTGENEDERLRLFYVAATRAKRQLNISYSLQDDNGKNTLRAAFLVDSKWPTETIESPKSNLLVEAAEIDWYQNIINPVSINMRDLLQPMLGNYKLSVTHLHNFLDVSRGGPSVFLLQNLLRFPSAKSVNAAFGTAIHATLQQAHSHFVATGKKQAVEDIVSYYESVLTDQHLSVADHDTFIRKGGDVLRAFFDKKYDLFITDGKTELNFSNQHSVVDKAHLTGKIDLANIDKSAKSMTVIDYKTSKPSISWKGKTDYEKIKLHKYKQQLLFYKLLVENARDYRGYRVEKGIMQFVEPTNSGEILSLEDNLNSAELKEFTVLVNAVWDHIINFNLPDVSKYDPSYKGMLAFEQDLINKII